MSGQPLECQQFSEAANCSLPERRPGIRSAKGHPCDAIINQVKAIQNRLKDTALGLYNDMRVCPAAVQMEVMQMLFDPVIF